MYPYDLDTFTLLVRELLVKESTNGDLRDQLRGFEWNEEGEPQAALPRLS